MWRLVSLSIAAVFGLTISACGASSNPSRTNSARAGLADHDLAYARCMRTHQVTSFPDPNEGGGFPKNELAQLAASNPHFRAAHNACQHELSNQSQAGPSHAEVQQVLTGMVRFAACMRSDGVRSWPDPKVDRSYPSDPRPVFELANRINPNAPAIKAAIHSCQHVMPQSEPPYMCAAALAPRGSQPGNEGCTGWLPPTG